MGLDAKSWTLVVHNLANTKITLGVANVLDKEPGYTSDAGTAPGTVSYTHLTLPTILLV